MRAASAALVLLLHVDRSSQVKLDARACPDRATCTSLPDPMHLDAMQGPPSDLWQTYKQDLKHVPNSVRRAQAKWKNPRPNWNYHPTLRYMSDKDAEQFMVENFDNDTVKVFRSYPLGVMKADMWRVAVLYVKGGLYTDVDVIPHQDADVWLNWQQSNCSLLLGLENDVHISNWAFAATPKHPTLKRILDLMVERALPGVDTRSSEHFVHEYTGPAVFTAGVHKFAEETKTTACSLAGDFARRGMVRMYGSGVCIMSGWYWNTGLMQNLYGSRNWYDGYDRWIEQRDDLYHGRHANMRCSIPSNVPCTCIQ